VGDLKQINAWLPSVTLEAFFRGMGSQGSTSQIASGPNGDGYFRHLLDLQGHTFAMNAAEEVSGYITRQAVGEEWSDLVEPTGWAFGEPQAWYDSAWESAQFCQGNDAQKDATRRGLLGLGLAWDSNRTRGTAQGATSICDGVGVDAQGADISWNQAEGQLWDALELICEVTDKAEGVVTCSQAPIVQSIADLTELANYLECKGREIANRAAGTILKDIPTSVVQSVFDNGSAQGVLGERGQVSAAWRSPSCLPA
jgi:hypothetical protein